MNFTHSIFYNKEKHTMEMFESWEEYFKSVILDYYYSHIKNYFGVYYIEVPTKEEEETLYKEALQEASCLAGSYDCDEMIPSLSSFISSLVLTAKRHISSGVILEDSLIDAIDSLRAMSV